MNAIHSTKIFGNFVPKLNGSVRSNRKSIEKNWSTFSGGLLFPVGLVGILVDWVTPIVSWSHFSSYRFLFLTIIAMSN